MNVRINIVEDNKATPFLTRVRALSSDRTELHKHIAVAAEKMTRDYLRDLALGRHRTATALGATPTHELERAAKSPRGTATAGEAVVSISPGYLFARAYADVTIRPGPGNKYLTIAVAAASYGKRAKSFADLVFMRVGPRRTPVLARRVGRGQMITMYVLVTSVSQPKDRSLLPPDKDIIAAAEHGAEEYVLELEKEVAS